MIIFAQNISELFIWLYQKVLKHKHFLNKTRFFLESKEVTVGKICDLHITNESLSYVQLKSSPQRLLFFSSNRTIRAQFTHTWLSWMFYFWWKNWKVVFKEYRIILILLVQNNFCSVTIWADMWKKYAIMKKSGVGNDTIDRIEVIL